MTKPELRHTSTTIRERNCARLGLTSTAPDRGEGMPRMEPRVILGLHRSRHEPLTFEHALERGVQSLDTAFNYHRFDSHRLLARAAGNILGEFSISSKVGYIPGPDGRPVHTLDPRQLRDALCKSVDDLGQAPQVMFLHNPEQAFLHSELDDPEAQRDRLAEASAVLDRAQNQGLCASWGWSCWDSRPILNLLAGLDRRRDLLQPRVLMVRAGLLVPGDLLDASEHLADLFKLEPAARWGMAPFGGLATDPLWEKINPRQFLAPHESSSPAQAVVRAAFALPAVTRVAVGTDDARHLDELTAGLDVELDEPTMTRYRMLLRSHARSGDTLR